jgi:hypothetical protein
MRLFISDFLDLDVHHGSLDRVSKSSQLPLTTKVGQ